MSTLLCGVSVGAAGCRRRSGPLYVKGAEPPDPATLKLDRDAGAGAPIMAGGSTAPRSAADLEFVPESFQALYPVFLMRKVGEVQKAAYWDHYQNRWVRWTGTFVSHTDNGFTVKMLDQTTTFDVALTVDVEHRAHVRKRYKKGDRVTYAGRLDSFEDVWRTFYLTHGVIIESADAGAPPRP